MEDKEIKFSLMVKTLRQQAGLTMKQLAEKMGKTESAISRWESGDNSPKLEDINALADFFNVDMNTLVYGAGVVPKNEPFDISKLANTDDDAVWDKLVSSGGRPLTEKDKAMIRLVFADRWDEITQKAKDIDNNNNNNK